MRSPLWPILTLFLALHALYSWAIPLGEGPDEPGHLAYVLFLATEGRLPVQRQPPEQSDVPGEGHQPPLAYALAVPAVAWLPPTERAILLTANPRFVWAGGYEPGAFMRGSRELWPWTGLTAAWHLARAVSGVWGALAVAFTYLAVRRLEPQDPWLRTLAAALVAFNPQLLFTTALVSNDALLAALGAVILWHCLDRPAAPLRWALVAGVLFGLAILTKQSALVLGPLLLWGGWRTSGGDPRHFVGLSLTWALATLGVAGWWFWRNLRLSGDIFGLGGFQAEFATQPFAWGEPAAWVGAARQLFGSFWARFGWMSVHPPAWTLWLYAAACGLAALGWARSAWHRRGAEKLELPPAPHRAPGPAPRWLASPWTAPTLTVAMAIVWILAFAATAGLVAWQGRMLFPALAAIAVLLGAGLRQIGSAPERQHTALHLTCCLCLFALAASLPIRVIRPAYQWVALAPREAQANLGQPAYGRFAASWEQGVVLRGWRLEGPARPATDLHLTLTWNSLEPVPRPWTVFVHLVDSDETIVAQSNSQPHDGALPFPLWTPGDWVVDTHVLPLAADLPPGEYHLHVGLYRPDKDDRRQKVWAEDGSILGDYVDLGTLRVEP